MCTLSILIHRVRAIEPRLRWIHAPACAGSAFFFASIFLAWPILHLYCHTVTVVLRSNSPFRSAAHILLIFCVFTNGNSKGNMYKCVLSCPTLSLALTLPIYDNIILYKLMYTRLMRKEIIQFCSTHYDTPMSLNLYASTIDSRYFACYLRVSTSVLVESIAHLSIQLVLLFLSFRGIQPQYRANYL